MGNQSRDFVRPRVRLLQRPGQGGPVPSSGSSQFYSLLTFAGVWTRLTVKCLHRLLGMTYGQGGASGGGATGWLSRQTDYREATISKMVAAGETSHSLLPWAPRQWG